MIRDSIDDTGKPFEPETPDEFFQRGEDAFHIWWSELDPPGWSGGLKLEYETARAVWLATYEHNADCIMLIYDGAEANAGGAHETGEMQLACVVHHHHDGRLTLRNRDFIDWVARHEDRIRREYHEGQHMDDDKVTVWIDHDVQSPPTSSPINRTQPHSSDNLRLTAEKRFGEWWKQLNPHGILTWMTLNRDAARVVWHESFDKLWEDLELVHDSAKAYADVIAETAFLELAYIVDRFHNGKLSVAVNNALKYWDSDKYVLERHRNDEFIWLRIRCVSQDDGG